VTVKPKSSSAQDKTRSVSYKTLQFFLLTELAGLNKVMQYSYQCTSQILSRSLILRAFIPLYVTLDNIPVLLSTGTQPLPCLHAYGKEQLTMLGFLYAVAQALSIFSA
jgi:hypothetical protein